MRREYQDFCEVRKYPTDKREISSEGLMSV